MRIIFIALTLMALLVAGGCREEQVTTVATPEGEAVAQSELTPEELGELGARIEKDPAEAQRLLAEKGLSEEAFEQAVRKVAEDPAASQRYAEAYRRTSA